MFQSCFANREKPDARKNALASCVALARIPRAVSGGLLPCQHSISGLRSSGFSDTTRETQPPNLGA